MPFENVKGQTHSGDIYSILRDLGVSHENYQIDLSQYPDPKTHQKPGLQPLDISGSEFMAYLNPETQRVEKYRRAQIPSTRYEGNKMITETHLDHLIKSITRIFEIRVVVQLLNEYFTYRIKKEPELKGKIHLLHYPSMNVDKNAVLYDKFVPEEKRRLKMGIYSIIEHLAKDKKKYFHTDIFENPRAQKSSTNAFLFPDVSGEEKIYLLDGLNIIEEKIMEDPVWRQWYLRIKNHQLEILKKELAEIFS